MSKRRNGKRLVHDLENEVRVAKKTLGGYETVRSSLEQHAHRLTPQQMQLVKAALKKKVSRGIDLGYLKTILYPDFFSYDIPQPLTNVAYSRFTDKQDVILNTGLNGSGMILWYPKTNQGPSLFYMPCGDKARSNLTTPTATGPTILLPASNPIPFSTGTTGTATVTTDYMDNSRWQYGMIQNYESCFTQTSLIAAVFNIQYIGALEKESGMWVGGNIYGQTPNTLLTDDIETSQYVARGRPHEGLRFTHLPMETTDYEYYPTQKGNSHNAGAQGTANETSFYLGKGLTTTAGATDLGDYRPMNLQGTGLYDNTSSATLGPEKAIVYASNCNYVALYWQGLEVNQNWIRVDTCRRFNGIPKQAFKNIVDVARCKKNYDAKKTFDVLRALCNNTPVGGHTVKEHGAQMDKIVTNLPNLLAVIEAQKLGLGTDETPTLEKLADALEAGTGMGDALVQ